MKLLFGAAPLCGEHLAIVMNLCPTARSISCHMLNLLFIIVVLSTYIIRQHSERMDDIKSIIVIYKLLHLMHKQICSDVATEDQAISSASFELTFYRIVHLFKNLRTVPDGSQ